MKNKVYTTLNNWISDMIVREALKGSYLAYVHLYAHNHLYSESLFRRLYCVVSQLYPLDVAISSCKLNPLIEDFFIRYDKTI